MNQTHSAGLSIRHSSYVPSPANPTPDQRVSGQWAGQPFSTPGQLGKGRHYFEGISHPFPRQQHSCVNLGSGRIGWGSPQTHVLSGPRRSKPGSAHRSPIQSLALAPAKGSQVEGDVTEVLSGEILGRCLQRVDKKTDLGGLTHQSTAASNLNCPLYLLYVLYT